ncbi:MAG: hypothetical protein LBU32_19405 [Clostridiales bacterium]|jgi:hypothetical protein|nr:hypothetical protein [Clostridiales bacterium]
MPESAFCNLKVDNPASKSVHLIANQYNHHRQPSKKSKSGVNHPIYRFSSNVPFFVDYALGGATDIGILRSRYDQDPKKAVFYENQYS